MIHLKTRRRRLKPFTGKPEWTRVAETESPGDNRSGDHRLGDSEEEDAALNRVPMGWIQNPPNPDHNKKWKALAPSMRALAPRRGSPKDQRTGKYSERVSSGDRPQGVVIRDSPCPQGTLE